MLAALALGGCGGGTEPPAATPAATTAADQLAATPAATTAAHPPAATPAATAANPPVGRTPALCARLTARVSGRVKAPAATELSGLVLSRTQPGVLWTHNDSGDRARLLAVTTSGRLLADVSLPDADNVDWEDVAAARDTLFAGDIGDNLAQRPSVVVYRIAEPRVAGGGAATDATTVAATRIELRYPGGPRDAEALLRDPSDGALVIVEKRHDGRAGVYVAARPAAGAIVTMRRSGHLRLGAGEAVTAGDVSADGRTIVLRTYGRAFVWRRRAGESVVAALRRRPCSAGADLLSEGQGEALALSRDGRAFYTVPEGTEPAIRMYASIG